MRKPTLPQSRLRKAAQDLPPFVSNYALCILHCAFFRFAEIEAAVPAGPHGRGGRQGTASVLLPGAGGRTGSQIHRALPFRLPEGELFGFSHYSDREMAAHVRENMAAGPD